MSTDTLRRRLDRLRASDAGCPIVVEQRTGETLAQLRRRVKMEHGDLAGRDLVIIERISPEIAMRR